jgi:hypothetical protein
MSPEWSDASQVPMLPHCTHLIWNHCAMSERAVSLTAYDVIGANAREQRWSIKTGGQICQN